jgi:UDP-N-acetylglucosamine 1-carboxyvinyltransferase
MSLLAAAVVTESTITIERVPIEFLEIELATLETMGMRYDMTPEYLGDERPHPAGRPHDRPWPAEGAGRQDPPDAVPGLNIDNLPFFALIAAWPRARR